jgi:dienelactone hydrolase
MYPGCASTLSGKPDYAAYAPLLILAGELDDWTPARYCQKLAERSKGGASPSTSKFIQTLITASTS